MHGLNTRYAILSACLVLLLILGQSLSAQGKSQFTGAKSELQIGKVRFRIGDKLGPKHFAALGKATSQRGATIQYAGGLKVRIKPGTTILEEVVAERPSSLKTSRGVQIGTSAKELARFYPELGKTAATGRIQANGIAFDLKFGSVVAIRLNGIFLPKKSPKPRPRPKPKPNPGNTPLPGHTRPQPKPDRQDWLKQIPLIWEGDIRAGSNWTRGPRKGWDQKRGVLLFRVSPDRSRGQLEWRPGSSNAAFLEEGDHLVDTNVLRKAKQSGGLLGGILGSSKVYFHFRSHHVRQLRLQIYWLSDAKLLRRFQRHRPRQRLHDGPRNQPSWQAPAWVYRGPKGWRQRQHQWTDPESIRWTSGPNSAHRDLTALQVGARIETSDAEFLTTRSPFAGGQWTSKRQGPAWIQIEFPRLAKVDRVDIGSMAAVNAVARFMTVEAFVAHTQTWQPIAHFYNEHINHGVETRRRHPNWASHAPLSMDTRALAAVRALRFLCVTEGFATMGAIKIWGQQVSINAWSRPPLASPQQARQLRISAREDWLDTGIDLIAGETIYFDTAKSWRLGHLANGEALECDASGIPANAIGSFRDRRGFLSITNARRPAPKCAPGALIARLGNEVFVVQAGQPFRPRHSGCLFLICNESNRADNQGELELRVFGFSTPLSLPIISTQDAPTSPAPVNLVLAQVNGTLTQRASGRPLPGVDVIVQEEAWPRRIVGGGRADARGQYSFEVQLDPAVKYVIRLPEFNHESRARQFRLRPNAEAHSWQWNAAID